MCPESDYIISLDFKVFIQYVNVFGLVLPTPSCTTKEALFQNLLSCLAAYCETVSKAASKLICD